MTDLSVLVPQAVTSHPSVTNIWLAGSRSRGEATEYSDWDFRVETSDFDALATQLPTLIEPLHPIAWLWDRLAEEACFMAILPGPVKVDLIFDDVPHALEPAYAVTASNLTEVDVHFWDWSLWLTSKVASGKDDLVRAELHKMIIHILGPMGVTDVPSDLGHAVDLYLAARDGLEARFGIEIGRRLASEVEPVVRRCVRES